MDNNTKVTHHIRIQYMSEGKRAVIGILCKKLKICDYF